MRTPPRSKAAVSAGARAMRPKRLPAPEAESRFLVRSADPSIPAFDLVDNRGSMRWITSGMTVADMRKARDALQAAIDGAIRSAGDGNRRRPAVMPDGIDAAALCSLAEQFRSGTTLVGVWTADLLALEAAGACTEAEAQRARATGATWFAEVQPTDKAPRLLALTSSGWKEIT